ncbi:MAG TPA: efflux RND transporter periplasmic adaptor subunit [Chromatiaceae bacterium]|nr:efflux RND transporter periplasmic adaptor subunit [Chromatiaceae bacterium]
MNRLSSLLAALLTMGLLGCSDETNTPSSHHGSSAPHAVETRIATLQRISMTRTRSGTLQARQSVRIFTQVDGAIVSLPFYAGDRVNTGDVLATLDQRLLKAELERERASRQQAELTLTRVKQLNAERLASDDELAQAKTGLQVALANESVTQTRLAYTEIKAPFGGIISERHAEPGDAVGNHTHILGLTNPDSLFVEVQVSDQLLSQLRVGDPAAVAIDAQHGNPVRAQITRIHPQLDNTTHQGIVELEFDHLPANTRMGQLCQVTFELPASDRLMIPFAALQRDARSEHIYIVNQGKAQRVDVGSGMRIDQQIEITTGLVAGIAVVTRGFLGLRDGKTVALPAAK